MHDYLLGFHEAACLKISPPPGGGVFYARVVFFFEIFVDFLSLFFMRSRLCRSGF